MSYGYNAPTELFSHSRLSGYRRLHLAQHWQQSSVYAKKAVDKTELSCSQSESATLWIEIHRPFRICLQQQAGEYRRLLFRSNCCTSWPPHRCKCSALASIDVHQSFTFHDSQWFMSPARLLLVPAMCRGWTSAIGAYTQFLPVRYDTISSRC